MSIDRCNAHGCSYDTDLMDACPECEASGRAEIVVSLEVPININGIVVGHYPDLAAALLINCHGELEDVYLDGERDGKKCKLAISRDGWCLYRADNPIAKAVWGAALGWMADNHATVSEALDHQLGIRSTREEPPERPIMGVYSKGRLVA